MKSISADRYPVYPSLSPSIQVAFCWAHQRRDFTDYQAAHAQQADQMAWAAAWIAKIGHLYKLNEDLLAELANPQAGVAAQTALELALAAIAQQVAARTDLPIPQRKLLESMHAHWPGLTFFVSHPEIPMDNNLSERDIRMVKLKQKISGCFRSKEGARVFAEIRGYLSTARKNGVGAFEALMLAMRGSPYAPDFLPPLAPMA